MICEILDKDGKIVNTIISNREFVESHFKDIYREKIVPAVVVLGQEKTITDKIDDLINKVDNLILKADIISHNVDNIIVKNGEVLPKQEA